MKDPAALKWDQTLRHPLLLAALLLVGGAVSVAAVWLLVRLEPVRSLLASQFWFSIILMAGCLGLILGSTALCIFVERKISAYIQDRHGPNRVGYKGIFQSVADGLKMLLKEDIIPGNVDRALFVLAPSISFTISMIGFAVIPWAGRVRWPWMNPDAQPILAQVASLNIGLLYILAVASLGVYGVVLAGFASNNKYSFLGGMRAAAQMISYEIPLGLGLLCILLTAGSLRLEEVVEAQARSGLWYVFYQPLAFLLMLVCGFAETNRAPFDLPECEQELVGGFHTEYSALKFGMFFLAEYAHMITGSALLIALFFGGWHVWGLTSADNLSWWGFLIKFAVYWAKIAVFIWLYMVVRWTLPRFRFDQLMRVAWKGMIPLGMLLVLATGLLTALNLHRNLAACLGANLLVLLVALAWAGRSRAPVTGRQANLPDIQVRPTQVATGDSLWRAASRI